MSVFKYLCTAARDCPNATAIEYKNRRISFLELFEQARQVAAGMQDQGLREGSAIGIMLPNTPEYLAITFGAFFGGYVVTPISVLATPREIAHVMHDSAIKMLFVDARFLPAVHKATAHVEAAPKLVVIGEGPGLAAGEGIAFENLTDTDCEPVFTPTPPDKHLLTLYTSGTTGASKGVMISDGNMQAQVEMIGKTFKPASGTRVLCVLPLFHAYALNALISVAIRYRATIVLQDRFEVAACANSLAHDRIQWFAGVPTMYAMLLDHGRANPELVFPELEVCLTGGAAMNSDILAGFEDRFGAGVYEGYGLTETTVSVASNAFPDTNRKIGSVGRPYPGIEARVLDEAGTPVPQGQVGELVFRGGNVMLGYLNRPDETRKVIKDGWLHSGDLGRIDEDGFCFIVGRKKDLIIKSGYNIVPLEVEEALRRVEVVKDASVVGVPDAVRGERILAAIILNSGVSEEQACAQIQASLRADLAKYKHPNLLWFVEQFPLGPSGKILKKTIRENWLSQTHVMKAEQHALITT